LSLVALNNKETIKFDKENPLLLSQIVNDDILEITELKQFIPDDQLKPIEDVVYQDGDNQMVFLMENGAILVS
jgi:hypothetical protein